MRKAVLIVLLWVVAGCVPATTPPQLNHTPGAPVVITDGRYVTDLFSVVRPDGWRVVTSAADAPLTVIFVSPDDSAIIMLAIEGIGEPPRPQVEPDVSLRDVVQTVELGDVTVSVYAVAPENAWDDVQHIMEQVVNSIELSSVIEESNMQ